jgi:hypothetical protein
MPNSSHTILVVIGGVLLVIGLLGGGIEISDIRLPRMASWLRAITVMAGLFFMGLGLYLDPQVRCTFFPDSCAVVAAPPGEPAVGCNADTGCADDPCADANAAAPASADRNSILKRGAQHLRRSRPEVGRLTRLVAQYRGHRVEAGGATHGDHWPRLAHRLRRPRWPHLVM